MGKIAGKVALVHFWGIECGPCIAHLPEVREAAKHFTGKWQKGGF